MPKWFPFHLSKISCIARAYLVPLLVLYVKKPKAKRLSEVRIDELFNHTVRPLKRLPRAKHQTPVWFSFFCGLDAIIKTLDILVPHSIRQYALNAAEIFVNERVDDEDGLGGIFPATANALMMYDVLGYPTTHPKRAAARKAVANLLIQDNREIYCQPCRSPVWDTAFAVHALFETNSSDAQAAALKGAEWLHLHQVLNIEGDWITSCPDVLPGGWAFQYKNTFYPDVDDTAVVVTALDRADKLTHQNKYLEAISRAKAWILGMQSRNGGWGAFDINNTYDYLNNMPFSDHGAMSDPPTVDVTSRCVSMLAQLGDLPFCSDPTRRALDYLWVEQGDNGSWFGRWGVNYIYGTWLALSALNIVGIAHDDHRIQRAVKWLISIQNDDGGWGESCDSYSADYSRHLPTTSKASQTAWALLGLMAAGQIKHASVTRGVAYLVGSQQEDGSWEESDPTGTGIPRVLYLRYGGYSKIFPLWAIARYRNLQNSGVARVTTGM